MIFCCSMEISGERFSNAPRALTGKGGLIYGLHKRKVINVKIDLKEFRKRDKYINELKHPTRDLIIWNYSNACQFDNAWDEFTKMSRGLITDLEGNIIARPFKKFFNLGQIDEKIPGDNPIIYEKLDGSLGIQYYDNERPYIATRGSFTSEQANWACQWLWNKDLWKKDFLTDKTYLYEIIYPENRIVVDYGSRAELVLLAVIDNETGEEMPYICEEEGQRLGISFVKHLKYENLDKVIEDTKSMVGEQEGYVFHWPDKNNFRLKIKSDEYVRLHRLITMFSNKSIWELLMNNQPFDELLEKVPDEFYLWVKKTKTELEDKFEDIKKEAERVFGLIKNLPTRKEQAVELLKNHEELSKFVFGLLDNKDISSIIWKTLRPKFAKPFREDIDVL